MKGFVILWFLLSICSTDLNAQPDGSQSGILKGQLINEEGRPLEGVEVQLHFQKRLTLSDQEGRFAFDGLPYGFYLLRIGLGVWTDTFKVVVREPVANLGVLRVNGLPGPDPVNEPELPLVTVNESSEFMDEDGSRNGAVSSPLLAGTDPFHSAVSFNLSQYRFRARSQDGDVQETRLNGVPMQDLESGRPDWASWSGLNDVMRNRHGTSGLNTSAAAFGGWAGVSQIDVSPLNQRKQGNLNYSLSNRSFRNRFAGTWNSGQMPTGWAFTASGSGRWMQEAVIPGTSYECYSMCLGVGKAWQLQELSLVGIAAWYERGKSLPVTKEAVDISGDRWYNPAWGLQQGAVRNARIASGFQPILILQHKIQRRSLNWQSCVSFQLGKSGNTGLDYYQASSPRPDYYRYMPSYFILNNSNPNDPDPGSKAPFPQHQQIEWDKFYPENMMNEESIENESGISGRTFAGSRSLTVLYEDATAIRKPGFYSSIELIANHKWTLSAGVEMSFQRTLHYRQLADLLGGDFFLNLNQFAVQHTIPDQSLNQYDLNTPDRAVRVGDKYAYYYQSDCKSARTWSQAQFHTNRLDAFVAVQSSYSGFVREGFFRNGLFEDVSFGRGAEHSFLTGSVKAGINLKIDGRNYIFLNSGIGAEAPEFEEVYVSPRMNNLSLPDPQVATIRALEAGYLWRAPRAKMYFSAYCIDHLNRTEIRHFYNDDPAFQGFVNYAMRGMGSRSTGLELGTTIKPHSAVSVTTVVALGQACYTQNPQVSVFQDNDTMRHPVSRAVYIRNYFVAAGPQFAGLLGCRYQGKDNWYAGVNFIALDRNYADFNPDRRTEEAVEGLAPGTPQYERILQQERLPAMYSIDLSAGKSWMLFRLDRRISRNAFLFLNASLNNLLDAVLITGGFEQLRYDFRAKMPERFPNKYFYGAGRSFNVSVSLRF